MLGVDSVEARGNDGPCGRGRGRGNAMAKQIEYKLISGDSHVNEPPELWRDRVPAKFADRAPRMQRFEEGDAWVIEGAADPIHFGLNQCATDPVEKRSRWVKWENVRRGGFDPVERLKEIDIDGVDGELLYPTPRLSNGIWWNRGDAEFQTAWCGPITIGSPSIAAMLRTVSSVWP